jgi:hypothetical protein
MNGIKRTPFLIAVVILIIGLAGAVLAFTKPTVTTSKQTVPVLNYQQTGTFDYKAAIQPAFFYDTNQQAIPTSPNIPVKFINSVTMNYKYISPTDNIQVEVDAVVKESENWQKTISIVPPKAENGNFSISFPIDLKSIQTLAATIDKELLAEGQQQFGNPSLDIDVNVIVYDKNTVFTHTLPVALGQTYMVIGKNLLQTQNGLTGIYGYSVALTDNTLFGAATISSPQVSVPVPMILGSKDTIFTRLVDSMNFTYQYGVTADQSIQPTETVVVNAILANPGKWSKTFPLIPATAEAGNFTLNFPLDMPQYITFLSNSQQETGVSATSYTLTLEADVHLKAQTGAGAIDKVFSDSISTDLQGGVLTWTGDLQQTDKGNLTTTTSIQVPAKILKVKVDTLRVVSIIILFIGLGMIVGVLLIRVRPEDKSILLKKSAQETERKYKNMIITVSESPDLKDKDIENILTVDSLNELIKVGQTLMKPINHAVNNGVDIYWLTEGITRYEYRVAG